MRERSFQPRWEKGQSILHKDDRENFEVRNSYGRLRYIKEERREGQSREGFALEAFEAPGTPVHTYREKHLEPSGMKKVRTKTERRLYASEVPLRNQAVFYRMDQRRKSRDLLKCLKQLLRVQGHQTLQDAFGFLEQRQDRVEREELRAERFRELTSEEFGRINRELDTLNDRILKKEAKERQLCTELQLMTDRRKAQKQKEMQKKTEPGRLSVKFSEQKPETDTVTENSGEEEKKTKK